MFEDQNIPKPITSVDVVIVIDNQSMWKILFVGVACTVIGALTLGLIMR